MAKKTLNMEDLKKINTHKVDVQEDKTVSNATDKPKQTRVSTRVKTGKKYKPYSVSLEVRQYDELIAYINENGLRGSELIKEMLIEKEIITK